MVQEASIQPKKRYRNGQGGWSGKRGQGKGYAFVLTALAYQGDECVLWPMSKDWHGYGTFSYLNVHYYAHRYVCEQVNGPQPPDKPYALHSCGNGHNGCITPKHLAWGTPTQNQLDSIAHGRGRKRGVPKQKLSDEQVSEIRALKGKMKQAELAALYKVKPETIGQIHRGVARRPGPKRMGARRFAPDARARMVATAKELRAKGVSYYDIAQQIDVSRLTAKKFINEQP